MSPRISPHTILPVIRVLRSSKLKRFKSAGKKSPVDTMRRMFDPTCPFSVYTMTPKSALRATHSKK